MVDTWNPSTPPSATWLASAVDARIRITEAADQVRVTMLGVIRITEDFVRTPWSQTTTPPDVWT